MQRRRQGKMYGSRVGHSHRRQSYKIVCAGCGKEVLVQVPPPQDKKLLCIDCFKK